MRYLIEQLGQFVNASEAEGNPDASLMEAFLTSHDEAAFAVLVRRHAPMVHGVCRRLLVNVHDVEDAFQATFLTLVRRAASVVPREMVGNWLYGVAYRTALKARARTRKSQLREQPLDNAPEPATVDRQDDGWRELRPIIDREIHGLPAKYRAPLVLCEIEGRSYREAAEQIGCPEGTVAGRLSRARVLLAARLSRRGVAAPTAVLSVLLTQGAANASVAPALVISTVNAAKLVVTGQAIVGVVSAGVITLTERMVRSMVFNKLAIVAAVLFALGLTIPGLGFLAGGTAQGQNPMTPPATRKVSNAIKPTADPKPPLNVGGENEAAKLLEKQIEEIEKQNPALAAQLRVALKEHTGNTSSSSSPPKTGGASASAFATATARANGSGGPGSASNATKSTFTMTVEDGNTVAKATENGRSYELVGNPNEPEALTITIGVGTNRKEYAGFKAVPSRERAIVERLIQKAANMQ